MAEKLAKVSEYVPRIIIILCSFSCLDNQYKKIFFALMYRDMFLSFRNFIFEKIVNKTIS